MPAADDLRVTADDARARGYEALADSIAGVENAVSASDPATLVEIHQLWVDSIGSDSGLLRLLGDDAYLNECAFPTAVGLRVIRAVESRLDELRSSQDHPSS